MEYVLKTYGLSKRFGSKLALDNVSINIKKGEIYGLIGKNGAGKTTLMRLALGLANPSGGSIELLDGQPVRFWSRPASTKTALPLKISGALRY